MTSKSVRRADVGTMLDRMDRPRDLTARNSDLRTPEAHRIALEMIGDREMSRAAAVERKPTIRRFSWERN